LNLYETQNTKELPIIIVHMQW